MKLRYYETMFLLHPELSEEDRNDTVEKYSQIIQNDGGQIVFIDRWPLRKLAYKVQKQTHGYYVILYFGAPGHTIQELTRNFRIDEGVMKFMTTKLDDEFDMEEAQKQFKDKATQASEVATESKGQEE